MTDDSSPESQLSVMRARQLAGFHDEEKYQEMRKKVIENKKEKIKILWLKLEKEYNCEVCELKLMGDGILGVKIRTPDGAVMDYVSQKEILIFMEQYKLK